jgi:type II secretory pathway component PulJ
MINNNQKSIGFTLVETLVSLVIFGFISIILVNIFVSSLNTQKRILQNQELMNQSSYALGYMEKSIKMADKDTAGNCTGLANRNYNVQSGPDSITFLAYDNKVAAYRCTQFLISGNVIQKKESTDATSANLQTAVNLTSTSVKVDSLTFSRSGDATGQQPRITIMIKMESNSLFANPPVLNVQTTVSQRRLNF